MKQVKLMLLLSIVFILTGCGYKGYTGSRKDLYTVAINSILWNNGNSYSADQYKNPDIEIIDEDEFGRIIFTYHEKHYKGSQICFSALVVCQSSNDEEVFYYEDINYIVKEQELYTQNLMAFTDEEIEQLKVANDWNKEIDLDKCIKKEITKKKPGVPNKTEIENKIIEEFQLGDSGYNLFMDILTKGSVNSDYIIYGNIRKSEKEGIGFIGLVKTDEGSFGELKLLVPENIYDYKSEFTEFKKANNWK